MPPRSRKKKARTNAKATVQSPGERTEKAEFPLLRLPLEIQSEILSYLHMVSLLQLARTTRGLRNFLLSRERSKSLIWQPAFKRLYPDRGAFGPEWKRFWKGLSEPEMASLLFEEFCKNCLTEGNREGRGVLKLHPSLPTKLCTECTLEQFCFWEDLPVKVDPKLRILAHESQALLTPEEYADWNWYFSVPPQITGPVDYEIPMRYHIATALKLHRAYSRLKHHKTKEAWVEKRRPHFRYETPPVEVLDDAIEWIRSERLLVFQNLAYRFNAEMDIKLSQLGWAEESTAYFDRVEADKERTTRYKHIEGRVENIIQSLSRHGWTIYDLRAGMRPTILADEPWSDIQDDWIGRMQKEREVLTELKRLWQLRKRIHTVFAPAFSAYVFSKPPNTVVPTASEVMWMPEWRSVLCRTPQEEDLPAGVAADAIKRMPAFIEQTMQARTEHFLKLVRQSKAYAGREVTVEHLSLASTFFRCNKCSILMNRNGYDLASFPAILAHHCSFFELCDDGSGQLKPRDEDDATQPPAPLPSTQRDEEGILLRYLGEKQRSTTTAKPGRFWRDAADISFDDVAHEHMNLMLDALGLDRSTTTQQMEEAQPYVEVLCQCYRRDERRPNRAMGMRWFKAIFLCKPHAAVEEHPTCFARIEDAQALVDVQIAESKRQSRKKGISRYCFFCAEDPEELFWSKPDEKIRDCVRHLKCHGVLHPKGEDGLREYVSAYTLCPAISQAAGYGDEGTVDLKHRAVEQ